VKLRRALVENFKGVERCEIDFASWDGAPRRLTALVGDNGSGKTTVLQAIALTLSMATRRTRRADELRWHGFLAERLGTLGKTRVELEVAFDDDELEATRQLYEMWFDPSKPGTKTPPSALPSVRLVFEGGRVSSLEGPAAYFQFLGRHYVKMLLGARSDVRSHFRRVGDVFWFDQHRNLGSNVDNGRTRATAAESELPDPEPAAEQVESWSVGVEQLRDELVKGWAYHMSPRRDASRDTLAKLEPYLGAVFPGLKFAGIEPRDTLGRAEYYFLFERDGRTYDLAELSSGEQAVFPLLREFVLLDIARSIVLIDELELHLHPPEQQELLRSLRKIGPDCQFIITTHSPYLSEALPDEEIVRLTRGRPCL
jgi:ABC-type lipoprotein export system ATPase subunit